MNIGESLLLLGIAGSALLVILRAWRGTPSELFSPRVLFAVLMSYYAVLGPLVAVFDDEVVDLGINFRPILWKGWLASFIAFASFLTGYALCRRRVTSMRTPDDTAAFSRVFIGMFVLVNLALGVWIYRYGGGLAFFNPLSTVSAASSEFALSEGTMAVYLLQVINLYIGVCILALLNALRERQGVGAWVLFIFSIVVFSLFCIRSGFRFRLAWLSLGLAATYYLWTNRRVRLSLVVPAAVLFVASMGLIGMTRNYWGGLSLERAEGAAFKDYLRNSLQETGTFLTLSQVVDAVPRRVPHTLWDPLWVAITYPIPRSMWPGKPTSSTLEAIGASFGSQDAYEAGFAVPYYGEWYIAFGWFGVIASSVIFGYYSCVVWRWYRSRAGDRLALAIYAVALGFVYVAFSRGLLAQAALNFCFSLLPLGILYKFAYRRPVSVHQSGMERRRVMDRRPASKTE